MICLEQDISHFDSETMVDMSALAAKAWILLDLSLEIIHSSFVEWSHAENIVGVEAGWGQESSAFGVPYRNVFFF